MGLFSSIGKAVKGISIGSDGVSAELGFGGSGNYNIQKRVRDAQKAGIHPLYAMGAQVLQGGRSAGGGTSFSGSFSPVTAAQKEQAKEQLALTQSQTNLNNAEAEAIRAGLAQATHDQRQDQAALAQQPWTPGQITAERLPNSYAVDHQTGRLKRWTDAFGNRRVVDQNQTPAEVLEAEFGEFAEANNAGRAGRHLWNTYGADLLNAVRNHRGLGPWSYNDIVNFLERHNVPVPQSKRY